MIVCGGDVQVQLAGDDGTPTYEEIGVKAQVEEDAVDVTGTSVSTVQVEEGDVEVEGIGVSTVEDIRVSLGEGEVVGVSVSVTGQIVV